MYQLLDLLKALDDGMLHTYAEVWGVPLQKLAPQDAVRALADAMLDPERVEALWDKLNDEERGALQMLIASRNYAMPKAQFERLFKEIRKMGRKRIEEEQPHRRPKSVAEGLFYRGFIGERFEQKDGSIVPMIVLAQDFAAMLPVHKTSYAHLKDELPPALAPQTIHLMTFEEDELENVQAADTAIVDDMTTLLAYLRVWGAEVEGDSFLPAYSERILPHLLKPSAERLTFMLCIGVTAHLISVQDGRALPSRDRLNTWLTAPRWQQVKSLAEAWHDSTIYQDIWHVAGLFPDPQFVYDPLLARKALLAALARFAPPRSWWSIEELIDAVHATMPDFQRPAGDYDSWYIRNADNEYLRGFASWHAVDGALLEFMLLAPMHWLGMLDLAEDAARLTAYGRAFVGLEPFPQPKEAHEAITLRSDGSLYASRKVARADRYQLARFTTWLTGGDPYTYQLDAAGLTRAAEQGITAHHVETFLKRQLGTDVLPAPIVGLLKAASSGEITDMLLEQAWVLRTASKEAMDLLYQQPSTRQHLGERLGESACLVLSQEAAQALHAALLQLGYRVGE